MVSRESLPIAFEDGLLACFLWLTDHGDSVQCVSYSPVSSIILSCAVSDIGIWMTEGSQKSVAKNKVSSRVCCSSWTSDGQYFSLGHYNGTVTILSKNGEEKIKIDRQGSPVWAMRWNPSREDRYDVLTVCDWGQKIGHYHLSGKQIGKDRYLGFDPLFLSYYGSGEYTMIGGSNKKVLLCSRDGVVLTQIGEEQGNWVWCCCYRPGEGSTSVVLGTQDGKIILYRLGFNTVHGLYKDRYAFRDKLTDVVVQNLTSNEKTKLKCADLVKKIAVYKNKLAVQLPEKILIFETQPDSDMSYVIKEKIVKKVDCSLMVACSENIILCLERKLQCMALSGDIEREWPLESQVRYIKVVGGPPRKESLLAGLKNGQIFKLFIDNPFPIHLMRIQTVIRCLDLSASRNKLAIVDENNVLMVYDLPNKQLLFQEPNASSVAWNVQCEDILCFSGDGILCIKASNFPAHKHRQLDGQGFVVGFCGSKIFSLHYFNMSAIDVPLSTPMIQYLERKLYKKAYSVACLGVTDTDWKTLAIEALEGMDFMTAAKAFTKLRDLRYLQLIHSFEERKKVGEDNTNLFLADVYAFQGKFQEAAKLYRNAGQSQKAVDMFTELRQFDVAREFMRSRDQEAMKNLMAQQADWAKTTNDSEAACEMYLAASDYNKAIGIMGENGWTQRLVDVSNELSKTEIESLKLCAHHLKRLGEYTYTTEVYKKMSDFSALATLFVEMQQWERAFELVESKTELKDLVYIPYATWLVDNDRFDEAQEALTKAGKNTEAVNFLEQLAENAINEQRFADAGYYQWLLARAHLYEAKRQIHGKEQKEEQQQLLQQQEKNELVSRFHWHIAQAEVYYVYHSIHRFLNQPFTSLLTEALFNMSRFLVHKLMVDSPKGVSRFTTLFTLAKQSRSVGAYKLARYAYDKLQSLKVPPQFKDGVDLGSITIRSKPFQDKEDLLPLCYRCSTTNPLLNTAGNICVNCKQPFVFSFVSFEVLPLVEFVLEEGISDEEALKLIKVDPPSHIQKNQRWKETQSGGVDVLHLDDDSNLEDPFNDKLVAIQQDGEYVPVTVDRHILKMMHRREVVVKQWPSPLRHQYYRSLLPDVQIKQCSSCNQMFHADDYELQVLCKGNCPFCREPVNMHI